MNRSTEYLLICLFLAVLGMSVWNSCNSNTDRGQYQVLQDSIDSIQGRMTKLYLQQNELLDIIDSLEQRKTIVIHKYEPVKASIPSLTHDSLAAFIRAGLTPVQP